MREQLSKLISEVEEQYAANPPHAHYGRLLDRITDLYEGKVGEGFSDQELESLYKEGNLRYEDEVPPGFMDKKEKKDRPPRELYGDMLIWKETLRHARQLGKGVILVTEDQKRDWWERTTDGRTIGPLPALRKEFSSEVGHLFHLYRVDQFADWAAKRLNVKIKPESAKEIREEAKTAQGNQESIEKWIMRWDRNTTEDILKRSRIFSLSELTRGGVGEGGSAAPNQGERVDEIRSAAGLSQISAREVELLELKSELERLDELLLKISMEMKILSKQKEAEDEHYLRNLQDQYRIGYVRRRKLKTLIRSIIDSVDEVGKGGSDGDFL